MQKSINQYCFISSNSDNVTLQIDGVLYLRITDPYKVRLRFQKIFTRHRYYRPEILEPAPSLSGHGVPIGGIRFFFFCSQNNHNSSGEHVLRSEHEDKHT